MKRILFIIFTLLSALAAGAQLLRPFNPRYNNASVRGNIVYVSNNIITSATGVTTEAPPGGTSSNNGRVAQYININSVAPITKLPFGSVWNYHSIGAAPANDGIGNTWIASAYTLPALWNTGASPVAGGGKYGYNAAPIITCIPSGCAPVCSPASTCDKYTAYYFRRTVSFTAAELSTTFNNIQLNLKRDDGVVIYINGIERARDNMPAGIPAYVTLATTDIAVGATENYSVNLSPAFFTAGVNTIAVEIHTQRVRARDMSFDMEVLGLVTSTTFSSSSADLNLTSCSRVLFAGLYWGASQGTNGTNVSWITGETSIKLRLPGAGTYTTVTSIQTDYHNGTLVPGLPHTGYRSFANITSLINTTNPNGTYTVADVVGPLGIVNGSGGWTIVVAFTNPSQLPRNLTIFDGSAIMNGGDPPLFVGVSGFLTPPSGPVSCELGAIVYDGDRVSQDEFSFKQDSNRLVGTYASQTPNATSNLNDMWNSTLSYKGTSVLTRNPAHLNTHGYDADIIDVPNIGNIVLGNSRTTASIRFSSPSENYFIHCVSTSIAVYTPSFTFDKTSSDINGGILRAGDSMRYQVNYNNAGNDASTQSTVIDNIPAGTSYLPGSLRINGIVKTDATGDDEADYDFTLNRVVFRLGAGANNTAGGNLAVNASGNVRFDVVVASSCSILNCLGDSIRNSARFNYTGLTSGSSLYDSSGVNISGCVTAGAVSNFTSGPCSTPSDTLLVNVCPVTSVRLPWRRFAGYRFYNAQPFIDANLFNPATVVSVSRVYWAFFNNNAGCADTTRLRVVIVACPDIDDDNDGIPDYVEINMPLALQDANINGVPNWNDPAYIGYIDNNADGFNDRFDPSADEDNDGIINFYDVNFAGYVDSNGDGVNDNMDRDLDGIPNHLDLDSDNDGIPDTVESYGVDQNGDGLIDNYSTSDNDGFSQNVDASAGGVPASGIGLGAQNFDGDALPNYLDADSDNDGIPDVLEALGTDANNDGYIDGFTDNDADGLSDNVDSDAGNDGIAENTAISLLRTGPDANGDGRADNYPFKNMDNQTRPNPYDLDSDMDGITDVKEAGFTDFNFNGFADGTIGSDGWNTTINALASINLLNSDGFAGPNFLDIDADDDGIPDNIEGQTTAGYQFPTYIDTDNDGIDNRYDNFAGIGGAGISLADRDGDTIPDYIDLDTDSDGIIDIIEGNDFNLNGLYDDNVALTYLDTDGDGLDNKFDSLNSVINIKGTSYRMGTGGIIVGDPTPGTRAPVQKFTLTQLEREWRYVSFVLPLQALQFNAAQDANRVTLQWSLITSMALDKFEIERSIDNIHYQKIITQPASIAVNEWKSFSAVDDISNLKNTIIYYRLKVTAVNEQEKYSNVVLVKKATGKMNVIIHPNPVSEHSVISIYSEKEVTASYVLNDYTGKQLLQQKIKLLRGNNTIPLTGLSSFSSGVYHLNMMINEEMISRKIIIQK